jgi:hypothetical protein
MVLAASARCWRAWRKRWRGAACRMWWPSPLALHEAPRRWTWWPLLDVLASPGHACRWRGRCAARLFGASDADLLWLAQATPRGQPWLGTLLAAGRRAQRGAGARAALLAAWVRPRPTCRRTTCWTASCTKATCAAPGRHVPPARAALPSRPCRPCWPQRWRSTAAALPPSTASCARCGPGAQGPGRRPRRRRCSCSRCTAPRAGSRAVVLVDTDPQPPKPERATLLVDWPVAEPGSRAAWPSSASEARLPPALVDTWALRSRRACAKRSTACTWR